MGLFLLEPVPLRNPLLIHLLGLVEMDMRLWRVPRRLDEARRHTRVLGVVGVHTINIMRAYACFDAQKTSKRTRYELIKYKVLCTVQSARLIIAPRRSFAKLLVRVFIHSTVIPRLEPVSGIYE